MNEPQSLAESYDPLLWWTFATVAYFVLIPYPPSRNTNKCWDMTNLIKINSHDVSVLTLFCLSCTEWQLHIDWDRWAETDTYIYWSFTYRVSKVYLHLHTFTYIENIIRFFYAAAGLFRFNSSALKKLSCSTIIHMLTILKKKTLNF